MPDADLPELDGVRPRARTASDDPAVEVRFDNGAKIRYRATDDGIREEWFDPAADGPVQSHVVTSPVPHEGSGTPSDTDGPPDTRTLSDRALCTIGSYLDFDGRKEAEFAWGEANVAALCDDA
ncbi:hypothetical protein HWV23_08025 [Natronomonas halophila]|uniref:hypothetical protein n=1 Tax=Natronomonas halophila TaxID=2747817 RepID=UPI0015B3CD48|nr:hypothetical protein [Natronomonas halophila]QLD85673.1 hypothetical protein HWV23_08025 [Natronomonas halophila]